MKIYKKRNNCAICNSTCLNKIIDYGKMPLAGYFPINQDKENKYILEVVKCNECNLIQINSIINPSELFKDYRYMSSVGLSKYFEEVALYLKNTYKLSSKSHVVEIGSNDGVLLKPLKELNIHGIGIDPSENISKKAIENGCKVFIDFFNEKTAKQYIRKESVDLVYTANCFAHIDDIQSVMRGIKYILKPSGIFVLEVHYLNKLISELQYDNIYHEHLYYYCLNSLNYLLSQYDMTIIDFTELPIHAGSIRVGIVNKKQPLNKKIIYQLDKEKKDGLLDIDTYSNYQFDMVEHRNKFISLLDSVKKDGNQIIGYGASGRANTLCNYCNIDTELVDYIIDESEERINRYIPNVNIPILDKSHLTGKEDYIVIFAWNYAKMIINKLKQYNYKYIIPFPTPRILTKIEDLNGL